MPRLSDISIEAWVIPNHIRCIELDTSQRIIGKGIPQYQISFTFDSVQYISKWSEYTILEDIADKLLQNETEETQAVIEVTWKRSYWGLNGFIYLYTMISNEGKIIGSRKKKTFIIPDHLENPKNTMCTAQERTKVLLG